MKRTTYNRGYRTEGEAQLDIAFWIAEGELAKDRNPKVQRYEDRTGKTKFKVTVLPRAQAT